MVDKEMLTAMEELLDRKLDEKLDRKFDEKLKPVNCKLDRLDERTSRLEEFAKRIDRRTFGLKLDVKEIKIKQLENNIIPRLNTIEAYYTSTLRMYREKAELIDQMNYDVDNLNITVEKHSTILNTVAAMAL